MSLISFCLEVMQAFYFLKQTPFLSQSHQPTPRPYCNYRKLFSVSKIHPSSSLTHEPYFCPCTQVFSLLWLSIKFYLPSNLPGPLQMLTGLLLYFPSFFFPFIVTLASIDCFTSKLKVQV